MERARLNPKQVAAVIKVHKLLNINLEIKFGHFAIQPGIELKPWRIYFEKQGHRLETRTNERQP